MYAKVESNSGDWGEHVEATVEWTNRDFCLFVSEASHFAGISLMVLDAKGTDDELEVPLLRLTSAQIEAAIQAARGLKPFVVTTENGERTWQAESAEHAREQHEDAFAGEPGEEIVEITEEAP